MNSVDTTYVPGVCNINRTEIAKRRRLGYVGVVSFTLLLALLITVPIPASGRLVLFLPAFLAASGFLQARNKFCVGFAVAGVQRASDAQSKITSVVDETARQSDKRKAYSLNFQAAGIGLIATCCALAVPSIV